MHLRAPSLLALPMLLSSPEQLADADADASPEQAAAACCLCPEATMTTTHGDGGGGQGQGQGQESALFDLPDLLLDLRDGLWWPPVWPAAAMAAEEYDGCDVVGMHDEPLLWAE